MTEEKKDIVWRAYLIYFGFVILMLIVVGKTAAIQFEGGEPIFLSSSNGTEKMPTRTVLKEPRRGELLDFNYTPLVTSVSFYDIHMDPTVVDQKIIDTELADLCRELAKKYPVKTAKEYEYMIRKGRANGSRYLLIKRRVTNEERQALRKFPIFKLGRLKGGLIDNEEIIIRKRPHGDLLRRTLGYVKLRPSAEPLKIGLEGAFNDYLKGEPGEEIEQKITTGWKKIGQVTKEAVEGADVITTFDMEIQEVAHSELLTQLQTQGAKNGCVIVMDVKTGFVKAMVNLTRGEDGKYYESFNHAIATKEVPGSTFKLASLMALLEDKKVSISDSVNAVGKYTYYGKPIWDSNKRGYGRISIQRAFEKSSNVYSRIIYDAYKNSPEDFIERLRSFGLDQELGVSIPGEVAPKIPEPGKGTWSGLSLPWMAIGYEVQQTPLQTLAFYNAVANNGVFMRPMFVKEIRRGNQLVKEFKPQVIKSNICSSSTLENLKVCLEGVVENEGGTGNMLRSAYFKIAGKTGTAVTSVPGLEDEKKYQASFVGFFPADDPIYSCIVIVAAPNKDFYGAIVSGTVFTAIANKVYASKLEYHEPINSNGDKSSEIPVSADGNRYDLIQSYKKLGVPFNSSTDKAWVTTKTGDTKVELQERYAGKNTVPNVIGMTAKDAVYLIESTGMVVNIQGYGKVVSQSMDPGIPVFKGGIIQIELK